MRCSIAALGLLSLACAPAHAQDPLQTDGDKYKLKFENDRVRVLEYRDMPGDKTNQHAHTAAVVYVLAPFKRMVRLPDGKVMTREFKPGEVLYIGPQTHIGENSGDSPTHVIMVELK